MLEKKKRLRELKKKSKRRKSTKRKSTKRRKSSRRKNYRKMSGGRTSSTDFDKINFLQLLKHPKFIEFLKTDENDIKAFMNNNAKVLGEIIKQNGEVLRKIIMGYNKKAIKEIYNSNPGISRIAKIIHKYIPQSGGSDSSDEDEEFDDVEFKVICGEIVYDIFLFGMFVGGWVTMGEFLFNIAVYT